MTINSMSGATIFPLANVVMGSGDWAILVTFFTLTLGIGIWCSRSAGKDSGQFFLSGRNMPWWLLGISMVATTFAADTPNVVTLFVRNDGVAGNWRWWAFLATGMLTVFVYAKLWRRSGVMTDVEFYELRYGGKSAAFLRGFRAIYLGLVFNLAVMSGVTLAAIKMGAVMFGLEPWQSVIVALATTAVFSSLGGFKGVVLTDLVLFAVAMVGSVAAAWFALSAPEVGGLSGLLADETVKTKLNFLPRLDTSDPASVNLMLDIFIIPLAVQWWAAWYPGAEPGGGGYLAQRMLAAKNENHAIASVLTFQIAHYALRPWPWILVALASLIVFPDIASLKEAFPAVSDDKLGEDLAYSAMLTRVPPIWLGIVVTSLAAAFMSTISTHLNWGSSYLVNDVWRRFVNPKASEKELVRVGRACTLVLIVFTALFSLVLTDAGQIFSILIQMGAGTGLLFILRWFWWRINAASEITAMVVSFVCAVAVQFIDPFSSQPEWMKFLFVVGLTTPAWLIAAFAFPGASQEKLEAFLAKTNPGGPGWRKVSDVMRAEGRELNYEHSPVNLGAGLLATLAGIFLVYALLFGTGLVIYGNWIAAWVAAGIALTAGISLKKLWPLVRES